MNEALTPYPSPLMGRGGLNQRFLNLLVPKPDEPEPKRERIKPSAWARVVYERAFAPIRPVPANAV